MLDYRTLGTSEICSLLHAKNIEYTTEQFLNNFWGTRIKFNKSDKRKVQRLVGDGAHIKNTHCKQTLCFELYD